MIAGWYTYRFSGYTVGNNASSYKLLGVGTLNLANGRVIAGIHQSSILRLSGSASVLKTDTYKVTGSYTEPAANPNGRDPDIGVANLVFDSGSQKSKDAFAIVMAGGDDRFWFMSTEPEVWSDEENDWVAAQDIVSGEAILMTPKDSVRPKPGRDAA
jgi:hypothetical protein